MTDDDRKAKDFIDAATQRDLERWFGLPSFTQLQDEGKTVEAPTAAMDPEMAAVIARRDKALAAVDPALLEDIIGRHDIEPEDVLLFDAQLEVHVDAKFGVVDEVLLARAAAIADPREYELSDELKDDMRECTPQALLRDLHRSERDFDKAFEIVDAMEEARVDVVGEVKTAMTTTWRMPRPEAPPLDESKRIWQDVKARRQVPWTDYLRSLPNRKTRE
ncbi:MAG TPA: hypothetical protein VLB44_21705 [Kofleriaceae bacterium]|nr:hypothetical protein [Kofleriaceae bacterium]